MPVMASPGGSVGEGVVRMDMHRAVGWYQPAAALPKKGSEQALRCYAACTMIDAILFCKLNI